LDVTVYPLIAAPPELVGAVKLTDAWVSPALAVPMVGAPGTTGVTVKVSLAWVAARKLPSPA
jgi:phage-related minor tail protein